MAGDEEQISFTILAGLSVTALITVIPSAVLLGSGILINAVLFHQGAYDLAKVMLLLYFHQCKIAQQVLHAAVQRSAIGLQQSVFCFSHPDVDYLVSLN